jgi:hypothetical protein
MKCSTFLLFFHRPLYIIPGFSAAKHDAAFPVWSAGCSGFRAIPMNVWVVTMACFHEASIIPLFGQLSNVLNA